MLKQDGRASIPAWFERLLIWLGLSWALALLHRGGAYHDTTIGTAGYIIAGLWFAVGLIYNFVVGFLLIGIPVAVLTLIYSIFPRKLKNFVYDNFIK